MKSRKFLRYTVLFLVVVIPCAVSFGQEKLTFTNGNYVGEVKDGEPNGQGTFTWPDGQKYVGEFKDGYVNGQGTMILTNGLKYVGEFKDGKYNGQGTLTAPDGQKYVGEWKDDKKNGQGTLTAPDGRKYVGEFKDGNFNGQGTHTWPDGQKYVGEWKDDKKNGQGTMIYKDGTKYVGAFKDDKWNGQGTLTYSDGRKYVGEFKDDEPNGQGTLTLPNRLKYVGEFKDGNYNGQGTLTLPNGLKYVGEFKDGNYNGQGTTSTTAQSSSPSKAVDLDAFLAENVALYSNSEVHYSFVLPDGWKEIPKSVIDKVVADVYSKTKMQRIDYTNGYQLSKNNYFFQYPYILIQKHNVNTPSYSQMEKRFKENTLEGTMEKNKDDLLNFMTNVTGGRLFFDKMRNIIFTNIQSDVKDAGKVNGFIAMFVGKEEIIQFNFYALSSEYSQWLPVFNSIIDSFQYKPAYVYDPEEAEKRNPQTFLDLLFKDVAKKGFSGLVTGVVLGIIVAYIGWSRFKKKKWSKSSQLPRNNDVPPKL